MADTVSWVLQLQLKTGELDNFHALMTEMVSQTRSEPGALAYEWFVSDDESTVHIYERYADSDATLEHLGVFGEQFAERFFACVEPVGFSVYGEPNDAVRQALTDAGAQVLGPFGGFAR